VPDLYVDVLVQEVAAAPPQREDSDATRAATAEPQVEQEDVATTLSERLLDAVMSTLSWDNDTRRDPIIIVVVVTLLFL